MVYLDNSNKDQGMVIITGNMIDVGRSLRGPDSPVTPGHFSEITEITKIVRYIWL